MTEPSSPLADRYDDTYRDFDSPLMRQVRREAYGEDIGQHSWVRVPELRADVDRLRLSPASRLVDLGCGPGGPLTFVLAAVRCRGTGVELSSAALEVARRRAAELGVASLLSLHQADLNQPLPFPPNSFDAAISLDVVLHLRNRLDLFRAVAMVLSPGGRFLFTDAGVVTGAISNQEVSARSVNGFTQLVPSGWNERLLGIAGLRLIETEDRTDSVIVNAEGRLAATEAHRAELEAVSSPGAVERQRSYLESVVALSRRRALSRVMYLAQTEPR